MCTESPGGTRPLAAVIFFAYLAPGAAVAAFWPTWVVAPDDVPGVLAVGLGGYALLLLLFALIVPRFLGGGGHVELRRRCRCAALDASLPASVVVVGTTVARLPTGAVGVRVLVSTAASLVVLAGLLWARSR